MRRWIFHIAALLSLLILVVTVAGCFGGVSNATYDIRLPGCRFDVGTASGYWYVGQGDAALLIGMFAFDWLQDGPTSRAYEFFDDCYFGRFRLPGVDGFWRPEMNHEWLVIARPWLIIPLTLPLPFFWFRSHRRKRRNFARIAAGQCAHCGYDLQGSAGACPECGATPRV